MAPRPAFGPVLAPALLLCLPAAALCAAPAPASGAAAVCDDTAGFEACAAGGAGGISLLQQTAKRDGDAAKRDHAVAGDAVAAGGGAANPVAQRMCSKNFPECHSNGWCYHGLAWDWFRWPGSCNADYEDPETAPCTFHQWPAKDAGKEMILGTSMNMDPKLKQLGIDLTGLWWMRGNPVPEVLASFARAEVNSSTFPVMLSVPNNLANHWSWQANTAGELLMTFYSTGSPQDVMQIIMLNATNGGIHTSLRDFPGIYVDEWGFHQINNDEWDRPTTFQNGSIIGTIFGDSNYTLTRVLHEDGSPTKFWNTFLDSNDAIGQMSFGNNIECMRQCQILSTCWLCQRKCR